MKKTFCSILVSIFVLFFVSVFGINSAKAVSDNITQINFITTPQIINEGVVSSVLTIEMQNSNGTEEPLDTSGTVLNLSTSSPTGEFSSNDTNWIPVLTLGMNKSWAHRSFYYKDSTSGNHTLTISAEGKSWSSAMQTITINPLVVVDITPPTLHLPSDITEEATSSTGAVVNFTSTADDENPVHPEVICNPITGSVFPIGTTIVNCSSVDSAGNTVNGNFNVIVKDTTPPVITLLGDASVSVEAGSNYIDAGATANDLVDGDITSNIVVTNLVDINTIGTYIISYNVSDIAGNIATTMNRTVQVISPTVNPPISTRKSGGHMIIKKDVANQIIPNIPTGQVLGAEKFNFTEDLFFGVKSNEVKELQKFLIGKGFLKKGAVGGFFGVYTQNAVKAYQKTNPPLWIDGIVGPETRAMLNK